MARSSLIPGFRFHPTDVELVMYYLKRKLLGKKITVNAIAEVNIYDFSPWDLPDKSSLRSGDLEWYFFCPKAKKYSSGSRSNRATETGFWKATGKDRNVKYNERNVASIKTLVFHVGHAGKGERTDWVMHEYKMEDEHLANAGVVQDMYVLCKVFKKSGSGPRNGAQYGAPFNEEEYGDDLGSCIDSQVAVGLVGASNTTDNKEKGLAATNITEPGSSIVTFSPNTPTNTLNVAVSQSTHGLSVTEPGSFSFDLPANADVMFFEDLVMGSEVEANKEDGIYDNLVNLIDLDELKETDFKTDGADYTLDNLLTLDDLTADSTDFKMDGADYKLDNLRTLDDLNTDSTDFKTDGADYTLDKVLTLDDLDIGLTDFKTDGADYTPGKLFTLDDLDVDSTVFKNDRADYRLDKLFTPDDLDVDLGRFYVD